MTTLLPEIRKVIKSVYNTVDNLCKPNPKYTTRHSERMMEHQRNKSVVLIYVCIISSFLLDILGGGPVKDNLIRVFFGFLNVSYLFFSCRYHPQIFKIYYTVVALAYGPFASTSSAEDIYVSFIFVAVIPVFIQFITGSFIHFMIGIIVQNILLNTFYKRKMRELLETATPEEVVEGLTHACNLTMVLEFVLLSLVGYFIDQAHQRALDFEIKKNEAENQKVFLLGFSHELRNLINSLTGNVSLACLETVNGRAKEFLHNAELCGELLLHMINNILDTGKSQINELEINPSPAQTYDTFERIWAICSELIRRKDLAGCMKIQRDMPRTLLVDNHRLTQIFLNLVGNAIKFTDKGSINVTVEWLSHKQEVREECFEPYPFNSADDQDEGLYEKQTRFTSLGDEYLILSQKTQRVNRSVLKPFNYSRKGVLKMTVIDTGCGMTTSQMDQLFQKFSQVHADEAKKKLGTGLGLFITKQLCQKMKGEVKAFSEKDKGSAFIFCLPVETTDYRIQSYEDLNTIRSRFSSKNLNVMIVDDAVSNHVILKNFFDKLEIEVKDIAVNGLEAYQKYLNCLGKGESFQIVAMDLDMPIMNGKEASRKIRRLEKEKGVDPCFLLIISGNCIESEVNECLDKSGSIRADAFIRKPLKIEELIRAVSAHFLKIEQI